MTILTHTSLNAVRFRRTTSSFVLLCLFWKSKKRGDSLLQFLEFSFAEDQYRRWPRLLTSARSPIYLLFFLSRRLLRKKFIPIEYARRLHREMSTFVFHLRSKMHRKKRNALRSCRVCFLSCCFLSAHQMLDLIFRRIHRIMTPMESKSLRTRSCWWKRKVV